MMGQKKIWPKELSVSDVFRLHDYIILTLPEKKMPMKFHPQICMQHDRLIGLELPSRWWQFMEFDLGLNVRLTKLHQDGVFYTSGRVTGINLNKLPSIEITHNGTVKRDQRRFFYRVSVDQQIMIDEITGSGKKSIINCPAVLLDVSAGGIGFGINQFLAPGTVLKVSNLLYPLLSDTGESFYELQVIWCTVQRKYGYRAGACFNYPREKDRDQMAKMVHQVQRLRMNRYYHVKQ